LKRQRSTSGYQPLDEIKCKIGPKIPHDPCPSSQGRRRATGGQKKEMKKPRPSPAGPRKSLYASSAHAKPLVHPLKVDSRISEAHITVAVRLKPRMTILPKRKQTARSRPSIQLHGAPLSRPRGARLARPTEGDHPLNTIRLYDSCLCAISQLNCELR